MVRIDHMCSLQMYHSSAEVTAARSTSLFSTSSPLKEVAGAASTYLVKEFEAKVGVSVKPPL